jgi:type IV secretion system protein VirB10
MIAGNNAAVQSVDAHSAESVDQNSNPTGSDRSIPKVSETRVDKAGARRVWAIIITIAICLVAAAMFVGHRISLWKTALRASTPTSSSATAQPRQFEENALPTTAGLQTNTAKNPVNLNTPLPSPCPPGVVCNVLKPLETGEWMPPVGTPGSTSPIPFIPSPPPATSTPFERAVHSEMMRRYYPASGVAGASSEPQFSTKAMMEAQASAQSKATAQTAAIEEKYRLAVAAISQQASTASTSIEGLLPTAQTSSPSSAQSAQSSDVFTGGGLRTNATGLLTGSAANAPTMSTSSSARGTTGLVGTLSASRNPPSTAETNLNLNTTALKGRSFECSLDSKLVSTLPGFFTCHLTENFYSANGKVLLAERGSEVTGETDGVTRIGQTRIPLLASRLQTPKGVIVNLDSPGTDALGGSGVPGAVNNHWPQRIGAALLLAVVQDGFALAAAKQQQGGTTATYQSAQSSTQNLATKVLDSTINTPPTVTKFQGERIRIFLARDLDFSHVYELTRAR